ncbi:MAG: DUF1292 domain-containing protein [Candidatus Obscuribacterales bacterium]|jgi:uncharacterized protein YrzB (UPF0473 family)|nr:DUF1292 domain-containing protein [Candidatus Obscuribacterales bacterium]
MANVEDLEEQVITLEGEDGHSYVCRILGLFEFDEKEYALLLNMGEVGQEGQQEEEPSTVVMQLITKDDQAVFRTIESDEEFNRVIEHVRKLANDLEQEEGEDDNEEN